MNNKAIMPGGKTRTVLELYEKGFWHALSDNVWLACNEFFHSKDRVAARNALRRAIQAES